MNNELPHVFTLAKPPTEDFLSVVRELDRVASELGIPFFLAGAAARDIILVNLWQHRPGRATADIDFGFAVNDWRQFADLRARLVANGHFEPVSRMEHRLLYSNPEYGFRIPVDFIPFGGVSAPSKTIEWPPKGDFVLNVAGFEEAFDASLSVALEPGLTIRVASLVGLAILKVLAWIDRRWSNTKDATDLYTLMTTYDGAGNESRIFDEEMELLEHVGYDLTLAGSELLGRDAARLSGAVAGGQIQQALKAEALMNLLIGQMMTASLDEGNTEFVTRVVDCFRRGYLSGGHSTGH
jgi:predicted nucleotidyltransferase